MYKRSLYFIFTLSFLSVLLSLVASEVFHLVPCVLCWYQRICMYPIALISFIAILKKDTTKISMYYISTLSSIGILMSLYHNLLQWGILPDTIAPCTLGVSCLTNQFSFGFLTIPLMSFSAFIGITIATYLALKKGNHNDK